MKTKEAQEGLKKGDLTTYQFLDLILVFVSAIIYYFTHSQWAAWVMLLGILFYILSYINKFKGMFS